MKENDNMNMTADQAKTASYWDDDVGQHIDSFHAYPVVSLIRSPLPG